MQKKPCNSTQLTDSQSDVCDINAVEEGIPLVTFPLPPQTGTVFRERTRWHLENNKKSCRYCTFWCFFYKKTLQKLNCDNIQAMFCLTLPPPPSRAWPAAAIKFAVVKSRILCLSRSVAEEMRI